MTGADIIRVLNLAATDTTNPQAAQDFWTAARAIERAIAADPNQLAAHTAGVAR